MQPTKAPWVSVAALVLVTAAAAAASAATAPAHSPPAHMSVPPTGQIVPAPPRSSAASTVPPVHDAYASPSVVLPAGYAFDQISASPDTLLLTGEVTSTTRSQTPTCVAASVDPATLHITITAEASCDDPSVHGRTVGTVNHYIPHSNNATIQIAHVDPRTGHVSVGPVVMTYASYSDTRPVTARGGGWLWIYDNSTTTPTTTVNQSHPGRPELLQVSAATGAVVDTVAMPALFRPIMAADSAGLWIGNSIQGTTSAALFRVSPGTATPEMVIPSTTAHTCWPLGSGDHLWAGIGPTQRGACRQQTIERFDGTSPQPVFDAAEAGYDPNTVVGDQPQGLWTIQWTAPGATPPISSQEIVRIDPSTGAETVVATLPPLPIPPAQGLGLVPGQAAVLGHSLYLLEPPDGAGVTVRYAALVKIPVR